MPINSFQILYLICLAIIISIRIPYAKMYQKIPRTKSFQDYKDISLQALVGIGTGILPIIYVFTNCLDFANYELPFWLKIGGFLMLLASFYFFVRSHRDLGKNWSPSMEIRENHTLIKNGIYKYIRHPMYLSFGLWCSAIPLMLENWIVGGVAVFSIIPMYAFRMLKEEKMLVEEFGTDYETYMKETKRLLPNIF